MKPFTLSDRKMRPSIPGPGCFTMPRVQRSFFAITYGCQTRLVYAKTGQKRFYTFSAPLAQRQIVGVGASLITMTFNGYCDIEVASQPMFHKLTARFVPQEQRFKIS
jgi:hypothetical protein